MLRITVVTPLYPIPAEPHRGIFIYRTVRELSRLAQVRVCCPVASYPRWAWLRPRSYRAYEVESEACLGEVPVEYLRYRTLPLAGRPVNGLLSGRRVLRRLEEQRPEVVLAYWAYPEGWGAVWAGGKLGIPVIVGARGSDLRVPGDRVSAWLTGQVLRKAAFVITVSEDLKRVAIGMGADPGRVRSVANGCEREVFHPQDRGAARGRLGVRAESRLVVFVGRLVEIKGVRELLAAARLASSRHPGLEVALVGDGPLREELEEEARQSLGGRVRFVGAQSPEAVAQWMAAADLLCLPSYSEGCPNVVLEALACGRPVVASRVGGIPEVVRPDCGILVPPGDAEVLGRALEEALSRSWDEELIAGQMRRGWEQVAAETYEICRRVVELWRASGGHSGERGVGRTGWG